MIYSKNYISYNNLSYSKKYNLLKKNLYISSGQTESRNFNNKGIYLFNIYNIYFLKKERIYTKLKYSRVPQFDTTSGAIASLLAALLGFLVTEKFGWELIDSGDFYLIIMYLIFLILSLRLILKTFDKNLNQLFYFLSLNNLFMFYTIIFKLVINFLKKIVNRFLY